MKTLTLGSIFDGSGGFPLGAFSYGIIPVWASEVEPFPIRVTTKRFPRMKHYGDVCKLRGGAVEPVDIITFGSPCTDMSVAGKRAGLGGKQSALFYEAVRVIKEMREETNGQYPRFIIFENVQGAFNSNLGADFQAILSEIVQIAEPGAKVPSADKGGWPYADILVGNGWSIAYRLIDAQFFSVPQRRKRIYLVADFGSERAGDILFEPKGVSRDFAPGFRAGQEVAGDTADNAGTAGKHDYLTGWDWQNKLISSAEGISTTLSGSDGGSGKNSGGLALVYPDIARTLTAQFGSHCADRGMNIVAVHQNQAGEVRAAEIANTLSTNGNASGRNAPLVAAFMAGQGAKAGSIAYSESVAPTLKGMPSGLNQSPSVIAFDCRNHAAAPISTTLQAKSNGGQSLNFINPVLLGYVVRRLTPRECALLQGFPSDWCMGLETPEPTEAEIGWWAEVFETYRRIAAKSSKPKSRVQIIKWLRQPHSDSAEYKLWGNGVALPCVCFVMAGIREVYDN